MNIKKLLLCAFLTATPSISVADIIPPVASDGHEFACRVTGLNPNGDGFLAIRTGPGSKYRKKGEVYNGDRIGIERDCSGNWCYAEWIYRKNGQATDLQGWFHTNWCIDYAG